ncbi:hypothetical protein ACFLVN_05805 [Chloroflexota bacterium]
MNYQNLFLCLADSETESDVIRHLQKAGLWEDPTNWQCFGGIEDNWSTIGNQQSNPQSALVEKLINSVDAMLMAKCKKSGLDPEGLNTPQDLTQALSRFFHIPYGKLSLLDSKARSILADNICLVATGAKSNPCYSVIDKGEGQSQNSMPDTILGLFRSVKRKIPFVQGKFHMGGTGTFRFSGKHSLQLIVCKRDPMIAKTENTDDSREYWGFTVLRREDPGDGRRISVCTYLAPENKVLRFKADSIPLLPSIYPNKFGSSLEWGTYIKLFEYHLPGLQTNVVFDLYNALSLLMPNIALPIRLFERRKGYSGHTLDTTLAGLSIRLEDDKRDNLEPGYPSSHSLVCIGQRMTALVYAFKKGQSSKYRRHEGIVFTVNGQTHGYIPDYFFTRTSVGMGYLRDDLLVIIDCTNLEGRLKEDLFMNSRDRLCDCELKSQIEVELERLIKEHPGLRALREKRRKEEIENKLQDSKPLADVINKIIKNSPTLAKLFPSGGKLSNPFKLIEAGNGIDYQGKKYPTYFRLLGKSQGKLVKKCPRNWRFRVQFETDAENDYFDRDNDPGMFTLKANDEVVRDYILTLWNGKANLTIQLNLNTEAGDNVLYQARVTDPTRWDPFEDSFEIMVLSEEPHHKGGDTEKSESGIDGEGKGKHQPDLLALPEICDVTRKDWETHKFDEYSGIEVLSSGDEGFDFYINIDNICLQTELKYTKLQTDPELVIARFRYGMVLLGIAMLREFGVLEAEGKTGSYEQNALEKIKEFTRAISPVLLPMISALSELEEDEVKGGIEYSEEVIQTKLL